MPRSSRTGELTFDPEIEKTARRLRWETKQHTEEASTSYEDGKDITLEFEESSGESEEEVMAIVPERTINDMTSPDLNQQPLCIEYPDLEVNFELKSGLIHLLPTFRGLAGEDPHKHLKEFHVVCSGMRPQGVTEEQIKLRAFPFSLADQAKDWLYFLPSGSVTTWNDLKRRFLEKYFPASRATTIRKEISGIRQFAGLSSMDRKLIDAASGGALFNKTPTEARNLISIMASNTQQFGTRYDDPPRRSNEVSIAAFDERLNELTSLVKKLAVERTQHVKACGICTSPGHVTDMCPTLQEGPTEHTDAIGGFSGQQQRRYDPFSNTYNPGWKDHPNLSYGAQSQNFQRPQYRPPMPPPSNPSKNLESQMSQLASSVSKLESQGKLPSQTVINPKQNASAIVLRSGKELQENTDENGTKRGHAQQRKPEKRFAKSKKDEEKEILETFRKVEVNIPLLDAIKQIPRYARFLKELCTSKGKLKGNERVGPLKETGVVIQLADRSVVYPEGVLEDVLVQVNELVFPADFYVLDMREDNSPNSTSILLGRPFLKTARTKIDVHAGTLTMEFDGEIIRFNIFDSMRYPSDIPTALFVDAFDPFVQKFPAIDDKDYIKLALEESPMPTEEENMGIDPLVQVNAKFDGDSVFLAKINKDLTHGPRTYKNKAFHEKISSRKNSLMNIKVKKPQLPSSKKHRPMYHYHNPHDNTAGKPAATVAASGTTCFSRYRPPVPTILRHGNIFSPSLDFFSTLPCGLSRMSSKKTKPRKGMTNMADVAGTAPHQQTTLDDIARRIARMEANLIGLFEHVGLTQVTTDAATTPKHALRDVFFTFLIFIPSLGCMLTSTLRAMDF
ncbi:UNVERIFIED_CONTAM: hypothetical protein Scaly_1212600 [Sesamum calycinum]|uniref:Retrotransposon gag domain-containing protein n=1 Tax=Sesamum calycinum TaxID=2727403 RepID=A0AAW2Q3V6_9LAMI